MLPRRCFRLGSLSCCTSSWRSVLESHSTCCSEPSNNKWTKVLWTLSLQKQDILCLRRNSFARALTTRKWYDFGFSFCSRTDALSIVCFICVIMMDLRIIIMYIFFYVSPDLMQYRETAMKRCFWIEILCAKSYLIILCKYILVQWDQCKLVSSLGNNIFIQVSELRLILCLGFYIHKRNWY